MRYEWQHRGSPHVHGIAWFAEAPDVVKVFSSTEDREQQMQELLRYVNKTVSTINPAVQLDGSDIESAPVPKTNPHICSKAYADVVNLTEDLSDLVATCQRHTRCSAAYCLRSTDGQQKCRFGYPKPLQPDTVLISEDGDPQLLTARNDGLVNSYNQVQLSAWRANVDMQYCVSLRKVIEYITKYASKSEPRSKPLAEVYSTIVKSLTTDSSAIKAVQKLLINSVGERDYSAQETCHLLLQLPLVKASCDFTVLSLAGSRAIEDRLDQDRPATAPSTLDHYVARPTTAQFRDLSLLCYAQQYVTPKQLGSNPKHRKKDIIVVVRPYCSPDPSGPKFEQYFHQKLMLYKPFRRVDDLKADFDTYSEAYLSFLRSGNIPPSLEDDINRILQSDHQNQNDTQEVSTFHTYM